MESINTIKYKKPAKYDKIPLISPHIIGDFHMFTCFWHQLEITDTLLNEIYL